MSQSLFLDVILICILKLTLMKIINVTKIRGSDPWCYNMVRWMLVSLMRIECGMHTWELRNAHCTQVMKENNWKVMDEDDWKVMNKQYWAILKQPAYYYITMVHTISSLETLYTVSWNALHTVLGRPIWCLEYPSFKIPYTYRFVTI